LANVKTLKIKRIYQRNVRSFNLQHEGFTFVRSMREWERTLEVSFKSLSIL